MKYYIKQKVFSFADRYEIFDENGQTCFAARGEIFTFGAKIAITNNAGFEVAYIQQEVFRLMPRYQIYLHGENTPSATIQQRFRLFGASFDVETDQGMLSVEGELFQHEYALMRGGTCVVRISKQWLTWGDAYEIDIAPSENPALMLAICIAIDNANHNERK